ncbi:MAG: ribosome biogenesis GTP-binding protein YihA/YsxC [Firmicutes bacterium]|nr:ribosome biogenesis GTP-binding protein YihA/YsxC [Bacillota bacterium]
MKINDARILISAAQPSQYPQNNLYDVAFAGRSNVGKSSLINKLTGRKALARISSTPGKTATINFYEVNSKINLVDLPGYGFARVSKVEKEKWGKMIECYLSTREKLVSVILLVDIRHKPSPDDVVMMEWVKGSGFEPTVIATKKDKLKKMQIPKAVELIKDTLEVNTVIPFSAVTGEGVDEVWRVILSAAKGGLF